jgi:hypothetical protein
VAAGEGSRVGNGFSFRKNSSERFSLFRGRNCSFRGIPRFAEESIPKLGTEGNNMKKLVLQIILVQQTEFTACFRPRHASERNSESLLLQYFCSMEQNSELFFLPRHGSEQNSKCLLLFLFHGTEFRVVLSSAEWYRTEFREFFPRYKIPSILLGIG